MPVKVKAKQKSVDMRPEIEHHHLTHIDQHRWHLSNWKKVLIGLGVILALAVIILGLALEA